MNIFKPTKKDIYIGLSYELRAMNFILNCLITKDNIDQKERERKEKTCQYNDNKI